MNGWSKYESCGVQELSDASPNVASKTLRLLSGFFTAVIRGLTWTERNGGLLKGPASSHLVRPVERNLSR